MTGYGISAVPLAVPFDASARLRLSGVGAAAFDVRLGIVS